MSKNCVELTVILKNDESTYRQKFLIYDTITLDPLDEVINDCVNQARDLFRGEPDSIVIRCSMHLA